MSEPPSQPESQENEGKPVQLSSEDAVTADVIINKLNQLVGADIGIYDLLPECVKKRVNALKNLHIRCTKIESDFYKEAHQLEMKYAELYKPLFEKRESIVSGAYEPTEEEAKWVEPGSEETDKTEESEEKMDTTVKSEEKEAQEKLEQEFKKALQMDETSKGIPSFWLTAMKNVEVIAAMIQDHDEEILKHLIDIKLIFTGKKDGPIDGDDSEMGFVLEFHFEPNEYFSNTALTKTYKMKADPDEDDPFSFEGPDIISCTGCKIDWAKGKNVTQRQIKKKQKHKGRAQTRIVTKTVQNDSFFNFFDPPEMPEDEEEMDEDTETLLAADFEIGHFFRERFIPKAVLFFTGEAIEDDDEEDDDDEDDEFEDEDDDDDEDDDNEGGTGPGEKPPECKNQ